MARTTTIGGEYGIRDYTILRSIADMGLNRTIKESTIEPVKESISENGFLGGLSVLRTKVFSKDKKTYELIIIDGQNRLESAKRLGEPYNYFINTFDNKKDDTKENIVKIIAKTNSNATNWVTVRYLDIYANLGFKPYQVMKEVQQITKLTLTDLQNIFLGGCGSKEVKLYKSGDMAIADENRSKKLLEAISALKDVLPKYSYVRRSLFKSFKKVDTNKIMKFASAIILNAKKESLPENEKELFVWVEKVRTETFEDVLIKETA